MAKWCPAFRLFALEKAGLPVCGVWEFMLDMCLFIFSFFCLVFLPSLSSRKEKQNGKGKPF